MIPWLQFATSVVWAWTRAVTQKPHYRPTYEPRPMNAECVLIVGEDVELEDESTLAEVEP